MEAYSFYQNLKMANKGLKEVLGVCAFLAFIFMLSGSFQYGYSVSNLVFFGLAGVTLGAISGPEINPKAFRYPALWQIFFSVIGCLLMAAGMGASSEGYAFAAVIGILLGYSAPYWIKHI